MIPIRPTRSLPAVLRRAAAARALCGTLAFLSWHALPALAQDAEAPAAEAAPADEAPAAKAKPKPKKAVAKPKPAEKSAEKTAEKPTEARAAETKSAAPAPTAAGRTAAADGTLLVPSAADAKVAWPNGASTVSEAYGDWTMNCQRQAERADCVVIQSQGDRRSGKRQFSVELRVPRDGRAEGLILMPFGLQIESGVTFKLDDRTLGKGAPYTYCVADGCLVAISLPTVATDAMKTAQALTVTGTKPDAKDPPVIKVPLSGFAAAFERALAYGG